MVCYHDIKKEKITYEYSLAHCIPGLNLESARIFSVNQHNILVIQVNKTHLVLIDFSHKDIPLLIEFSVEKVLAVHSIVNTPHILLITQKSEIEGVDVAFYTFKMFNESDKSSIQSEDNIVEVPNILEPTLSESLVLDSQYVSALESVLVLVKTHYDTLELKNLKITGVEDIISAKLDKFKDHDLIRGQINITNGYIISDSIYHSSNAEQFSVSVEFFISDSIKLYVHEFTSEDEKFSLKSIAELFFNTLKVPKNISENVSVPKNQDILTVNEINELLFSNQTEEICAEVFATENEEFVHNLAELKVFIDNKRQDLLLIVDSDCSLETFQKARRYIRSLTQIMKAIKERRIIEAECNKAKVHSENYTESDLRDLRSLESELEVLNKLHQRIFYMYLIVKHNIRASFDNQKEVIIKKTETRELFKADRYQKVFDSFTQKYIHDTPLLMKVILKEAGLEQVYPFHSFNELLEFIAKDISIATMDFVMIYLILDILGEKNEEEILMSQLRTLPNWSEYYLYWAADSSYD